MLPLPKLSNKLGESIMNIITLNSEDFSNTDELHLVLIKKLNLPEHYGRNLDALWDCLTGWIDLPITIKWVGYDNSSQRIGEYAEKLATIFQDAEKEIEGFKFIKE